MKVIITGLLIAVAAAAASFPAYGGECRFDPSSSPGDFKSGESGYILGCAIMVSAGYTICGEYWKDSETGEFCNPNESESDDNTTPPPPPPSTGGGSSGGGSPVGGGVGGAGCVYGCVEGDVDVGDPVPVGDDSTQ